MTRARVYLIERSGQYLRTGLTAQHVIVQRVAEGWRIVADWSSEPSPVLVAGLVEQDQSKTLNA